MVKNPPAVTGDTRCGFNPWVRKVAWRREWQPTPVLLPGKVHGQRNLVGYSSGGRKDLDMTEHTCSNKVRSVYQMVSKLNAVGTLFFYTSVNILMPFT